MESRSSLADSPPFIRLIRRVNLLPSDPSSFADLIFYALVIQAVVYANKLVFEKELRSMMACFSMH